MHSIATKSSNLPEELKAYLAKCGFSASEIAKCRLETRLYQDLGIYGDIAESYMEVLADSFNVDLSGFLFDKYFPLEFSGDSSFTRFLTTYIPWGKWIYHKNHSYNPMTLEMILNAIKCGKFLTATGAE